MTRLRVRNVPCFAVSLSRNVRNVDSTYSRSSAERPYQRATMASISALSEARPSSSEHPLDVDQGSSKAAAQRSANTSCTHVSLPDLCTIALKAGTLLTWGSGNLYR